MERTLAGAGLVAAGGFLGAVTRYGVDVAAGDVTGLGTLLVNVLGSFVLGLLVTRVVDVRIRLLVGTGLVSSFTTYSTFAAETVALDPTLAALNVAGNYVLGFLAVLCARTVVRWL